MAYCCEPDDTRERKAPHISGDELCVGIDRPGSHLSRRGRQRRPHLVDEPYKQMSGGCKLSRHTKIIQLEKLQRSRKGQGGPPKGEPARRRSALARYLYPTSWRGKPE